MHEPCDIDTHLSPFCDNSSKPQGNNVKFLQEDIYEHAHSVIDDQDNENFKDFTKCSNFVNLKQQHMSTMLKNSEEIF